MEGLVEGLQTVGAALIVVLQGLSPLLDGPMLLLTLIGNTELYLVVLPVVYWVAGPALALRLLLPLLLADALTSLLKQAVLAPRPYWLGTVRGLAAANSYGFPSGHASTAMAFWGTMARLRLAPWPLALLVIGLVSLSRLYLGVHYPHDIVGGWLIGLAALWLLTAGERRLWPWLKEQALSLLLALALAASLAIVAAGLLVQALMAGAIDPAAWANYAVEARGVERYLTDGGLLFGAMTGSAILFRRLGVRRPGRLEHAALATLLGLVGVALIWRELALGFAAIAPDASWLGGALRYLRYALLGLWITLGAPWLFQRLGLARQADEGG
jgi:membrane-associated phospholipid phosphatase